jgi:hypothetical protein
LIRSRDQALATKKSSRHSGPTVRGRTCPGSQTVPMGGLRRPRRSGGQRLTVSASTIDGRAGRI